jgi:hypothetical protein
VRSLEPGPDALPAAKGFTAGAKGAQPGLGAVKPFRGASCACIAS